MAEADGRLIAFILDTDHISLYRRGHPVVRARIAAIPSDRIGVAIISVEEQIRGRLAQVQRAQSQAEMVMAYSLLQSTLAYFTQIQVLPFDGPAATQFSQLKRQITHVGIQDLRIGAIALANHCTVVTRNWRDFERIPGLKTEDWTMPIKE
jgi:tRNA(fMet)-specific endonuclease VapC